MWGKRSESVPEEPKYKNNPEAEKAAAKVAEMISGGATMQDGRVEATAEQVDTARAEMDVEKETIESKVREISRQMRDIAFSISDDEREKIIRVMEERGFGRTGSGYDGETVTANGVSLITASLDNATLEFLKTLRTKT